MDGRPKIAVVTHQLDCGGGAASMAVFLHRALNESGQYRAGMISLAMSSSDSASRLLRRPGTWSRGAIIENRTWRGIEFAHVGADWAEYEPCRYQPREALTRVLNGYDLVQVVVGTPPWACAAMAAAPPCLLWTATTLRADRLSAVNERPAARRWLGHTILRRAEVWERRALERAAHVFALSPYTMDSVRRMAPGASVTLAACGVDTSLFRPDSKLQRNRIVSVARFQDARKNVGLLLEAYRRVLDRRPESPDLYLIGDPPTAAAQKRLAELRLTGRVHLRGPVDPRQLAELHRESSFLVLSSDEEGLGIALLEAMACGAPVIATRCGGPDFVVADGETGYLTPVGDAEALAAAMLRMIDDPERTRHMGRIARLRVERDFSLEAAGRVFFERYDALLHSAAHAHV